MSVRRVFGEPAHGVNTAHSRSSPADPGNLKSENLTRRRCCSDPVSPDDVVDGSTQAVGDLCAVAESDGEVDSFVGEAEP